jgi:excisionase family DNA binding protein
MMGMTSSKAMAEKTQPSAGGLADSPSSRISVLEIARRLNIGRLAVYSMLEQGILPGVRLGRRRIITRQAYLAWERTCGRRAGAGLRRRPEVTVVH